MCLGRMTAVLLGKIYKQTLCHVELASINFVHKMTQRADICVFQIRISLKESR